MEQYFAELDRRFPTGFSDPDALDSAATDFVSPHGLFLLVVEGEATLGCGALQFLNQETAEIKRMWVNPVARGRGIGKALLRHLEQQAATAGSRRVVLDTNASLTEAITMYGAAGYTAIARYNDNPYAERWFAKALVIPQAETG